MLKQLQDVCEAGQILEVARENLSNAEQLSLSVNLAFEDSVLRTLGVDRAPAAGERKITVVCNDALVTLLPSDVRPCFSLDKIDAVAMVIVNG